jgi:D-beta-D-heptose 7-phosphate kinase/D-beta-D-heptose 1-phosphate adenosyltransferase
MGGNVHLNLLALGNTVDFICNEEEIIKERIIDNKYHQLLLRIDTEPDSIAPLRMEDVPSFSDYDAVVVSDYNKGFLPLHTLADLAHKAYVAGIPVFMDTKKPYIAGVTDAFIKLNESEWNAMAMHGDLTRSNEYIVTLGEKGARWCDDVFPARKVSLFDQTGAGDTFLSAFTTAYLSSGDMPEAIDFANFCSSISVTKLGCYAVTLDDINDCIEE